MLRSGRLRKEMLQATVLVGLQQMIGQSTNSVTGYIGCALIGLYKISLGFNQPEYSRFYLVRKRIWLELN